MTTETTYIADDGTRFDNEWDCEQYEEEKEAAKFKDTALLFDRDGKALPISKADFREVYFIKAVTDEAAEYMAGRFQDFGNPWNDWLADTNDIKTGCWFYFNQEWRDVNDFRNIMKILREIGEEI